MVCRLLYYLSRMKQQILFLSLFLVGFSLFAQKQVSVSRKKKITCNNYTNPGSVAANQSSCTSFNPTAFTSTSLPSGGSGGTAEYQWQSSADNITWSDISGATSTTYDAPLTNTTTYFRRGAKRSDCISYIHTSALTITVGGCCNFTSAGVIGSNQNSCPSFNPANMTGTAPSGGSGGTTQYQWQVSTNNISWSNIGSATGASYNPPTITATRYYRRRAKRSTCTSWLASNTVTKAVGVGCCTNYTDAGTIGYDQSGCGSFDPANIVEITPPSGQSGSGFAQMYWQVSTNGITWSLISGTSGSSSYNPPTISSTRYYRRMVAWCGSFIYSNVVTISTGNLILSGWVFDDQNFNSINDAGDGGINGLQIDCYQKVGASWVKYTDGFSGNTPTPPPRPGWFAFCVPAGQYYLEFKAPIVLVPTTPFVGTPTTDSDVDESHGPNTTRTINVFANEGTIGAGFQQGWKILSCTPTVNGVYKRGVPMNASNTIDVSITVNIPGTYPVWTNYTNGYRFSGTFTATTTGIQTVTIPAIGTPVSSGTNNFYLGGGGSCWSSFSVNVIP